MPLFEFKCKKCNELFETLVLNYDDVSCPKCGSTEVIKQFSRFASISASSNCSNYTSCRSEEKNKHKCCGGCC